MISRSYNNIIKIVLLLIVSSILLSETNVFGQVKNDIEFTHLTTANGLSQSTVNCILKDRYGFMWFGTQDGLNRYDGYKFKVYRNDPTDKKSILHNNVRCLLEDRAGNLWIGTVGGGLELYDRNSDSFIAIGTTETKDEKLGSKIIKAIYEDSHNNIWVGTVSNFNLLNIKTKKLTPFAFNGNQLDNIGCIYEDKRNNLWVGTTYGLHVWDRKANTFNLYANHPQIKSSLSADNVNAIAEDKYGNLWVGTTNGLNKYDYNKSSFLVYKKEENNPTSLRDNVIKKICTANDGKLWVATEKALELYDTASNAFTHFQQNSRDVRSLSCSSISSLLLDNQGILWVGTVAGGINKYDKNQFKFSLYRDFGTDASNINANIVTSFAETKDGDIWVGTDGGGLYNWHSGENKFTPYNTEVKENYFASLYIICLQLSREKDYLWIGTYDKGLVKLNLKTKTKTYYLAGDGDDKLSNQSVYKILEDKKGNIWIGTNGGGVNILNTATNKIKHLTLKTGKDQKSANYIRSLYEDKDGNIWIGTIAHGVIVYNPETEKFIVFDKANSNLGSNVIYAIYGDTKNNIWVGTMGGGLYLYQAKENKFKAFTESQGLTNNIINSIIEDKFGCLWISTDNGISCFNAANGSFKNYSSASGLQSKEFSLGAGYRLNSGEILFGGLEGFNLFKPGNFKDNIYIPPVVITDFQLFNKSVPITENKLPLSQNINTAKQVTLAYDQSVFTIEFAALGYTVPEQNKYSYMLEGFDKGWNYVGTERKTTYTNLDAGTYLFKVKASNNDGLWNEKETKLQIIILPPFWKTAWAYILYTLVIMGVLFLVYKEITAREKLKNEVHYQKLITDKTQELNQLKLNFFTNISHDLRTPLSLIIDPLRKIMTDDITVVQAKKYSKLVFNNASMLMNLVNQLLDFRKVETGSFKLNTSKVEVMAVIKNVFQAFIIRARERNINYHLELKIDYLKAWMDVDKLEKVLYNLIANAFKYTPDFGIITVLVKLSDNTTKKEIEIHIKDSGIGIPNDLKSKIFDVFYQIKGSPRFEKESSGIGLALSKELVLLQNGEIFVTDSDGEGTDFIVRLPIGDDYNMVSENSLTGTSDEMGNGVSELYHPKTESIPQPKNEKPTDAPILLIVEDNQELREYLAEELSTNYSVVQAINGVDGFNKAIDIIPDIIISDIMMPECDGLELCNKLKEDEKTSHIPIILLTAKQTDENKITGYNHGADDYISKPFNVALIAARINNILESRKKLRALFTSHPEHLIEASEMSDIDKEFLRKATKNTEENLSDINFDIDQLATSLKMSRRQLYRKLSALTNQTAHDFIMDIRLDNAVAFLKTGDFTVSEIAYKVGFSEPSNFSRSFTKKFGQSPKKYVVGMK